jgi:hypothetical protein
MEEMMITAKKILDGNIETERGEQKCGIRDGVVWELSEPVPLSDGNDEKVSHIITSSVVGLVNETYAFACEADGFITRWGDLPGSINIPHNHQAVIDEFLTHVNDVGHADY